MARWRTPKLPRGFLGQIETEVDALTQMATELLELSRIESGQVPLQRKAVPAATLLPLGGLSGCAPRSNAPGWFCASTPPRI